MKTEFNLKIDIIPELTALFPNIRIGILTGNVVNQPFNTLLWKELDKVIHEMGSRLDAEQIREWAPIREAKDAYRRLGKDPNRYRVSAEAMLRRMATGKGLYQINALVDSLNLVSITTGITIGGFDLDKIQGDVHLGIGKETEPFEAINRGELNIHRLPVYRDEFGAIGSPTSDCTRTMITLNTQRFLMIITDFFGSYPLEYTMTLLRETIAKFTEGSNFTVLIQENENKI